VTGLLTNLETSKQSIQSQKLLIAIENSLCDVREKELAEKLGISKTKPEYIF